MQQHKSLGFVISIKAKVSGCLLPGARFKIEGPYLFKLFYTSVLNIDAVYIHKYKLLVSVDFMHFS